MVIDFHTHIFPDALAARAIGGLEQSGNVKSVLSGRREDLLASMKRAGVDYSLNLPIASRPKQVESINSFAIRQREGRPVFPGRDPSSLRELPGGAETDSGCRPDRRKASSGFSGPVY